MILVIDVGNTSTQLGIFKGDELIHNFRYLTKEKRTSDELGMLFYSFFSTFNIDYKEFEGVIVSSVVPDANYSLLNAIRKYLYKECIIVGSGIKTGINVQTDDPREVGADRIVDIVAAYNLYGGPAIVVNFGTATRYDYVDKNGAFNAAITSPGIQIAADALWSKAAKLPNIEIKKPDSILARNTVSSMQAGLVYGYIGQCEYIINKIKEEVGISDIKVVSSGGYAKIIYPHTDVIQYYDPILTLKGLKIIYDKNK